MWQICNNVALLWWPRGRIFINCNMQHCKLRGECQPTLYQPLFGCMGVFHKPHIHLATYIIWMHKDAVWIIVISKVMSLVLWGEKSNYFESSPGLMMKTILRKVPKAFLVSGGGGPACSFAGAASNEGERQVRVPEDTPPGKLNSKSVQSAPSHKVPKDTITQDLVYLEEDVVPCI